MSLFRRAPVEARRQVEEDLVAKKARERFEAIQHADLKTAKAWAIKENLRHTWTQPDGARATEHLTAWCRWALSETLTPITKVALLIKEKFVPIVRYCTHRITTGPAEGINSKLMAVQRQARGHRGFANFRISVLFHCGGLSLLPAMG